MYFRIYSVAIVLQPNLVCFGQVKMIIWHPFDYSRSLYDPNTTKLGHERPGEFVSERLLIHGSGYVVFLLFNNPILYVLANIETDHNIRLIIIQACLTLMLQKGYHETPSRLLLSPSRSVFQELERSYCLTVQSIMVLGHMETDHDIHLIIHEAIMTIILQRGVTRDPGRLQVCF